MLVNVEFDNRVRAADEVELCQKPIIAPIIINVIQNVLIYCNNWAPLRQMLYFPYKH
jgi:hypothetical protein